MKFITQFLVGTFSLIICISCNTSNTLTNSKPKPVTVSQYATDATAIFTNAYILELEKSIVVIDATLTVSAAKTLRQKVEALNKPLKAVFITHGHPDHYNGLGYLTEGLAVDIYSTQSVLEVISESDAEKEKQWTPMFGDEWPRNRVFPNKIIKSQEKIVLEGVSFQIHEVGPGESHSDSYITMDDQSKKVAFVGDIVLHQVHAYTTDGHLLEWLKTLDEISNDLKEYQTIYPGHGKPGGVELFTWQKEYLTTYIKNVQELLGNQEKLSKANKQELAQRMQVYLPNDKLLFLVGLGADIVAQQIKEGTLQEYATSNNSQ